MFKKDYQMINTGPKDQNVKKDQLEGPLRPKRTSPKGHYVKKKLF
jgi:hypothetical protein